MDKDILANGEIRYRARIKENGKRRNVTTRTVDEMTDTLQDIRERERRRKRGIVEPTGDVTFGDLADKLLSRYMKRESSKISLENNLAYSRPVFDKWLVRDI